MKTLQDQDAFLCTISRRKKLNLTNINLHYEIIEKVIDKRGTSSTTYTETLYRSENKSISNFKNTPKFKFQYPQRNDIHSLEYGDGSIYWQMNLEGKYFWMKFKYTCVFTVRRV